MILKIITGESGTDFEIGAEKRVNRRSLASISLRALGTLALVWLLVDPLWLSAQTNLPAPKYPRNRFLLVVETSRGMARRAEPMRQAVQGVLRSALAGQAHSGDTLGVWTFNEDVYTGILPLQQWSPATQDSLVQRVDGFISAQKFEKRARFDKLIPDLERLARNSRFITVILVCLGDTDIQGTPFDAQINQFLRTWRAKEPDAGTPFVIALRGQAGRFVDCSLNPSPWPAELPALPKELLTPLPPVQPSIAQTRHPATSSVPPLIISGKKHASVPEPTPTNAPATTAPMPAATPASVASSSLVQPSPSLTPTAAAPTPGQSIVPQNSNLPPQSQAAGLPASSVPAPEKRAETLAVSEVPPKSESGALVAKAAEIQSSPPATAAADAPAGVPDAPPQEKPVQVATSVPVNRPVYIALLTFTGLVSLGAIVGAIWLWRLRNRRANESSLITESLDRRKN